MAKKMQGRRVEIPWDELEEILQKRDVVLEEERIKEITLVNPKKLYIYLERK